MQNQKFVLSYWKIRGVAQIIRNLLEYLQLPYEDRIVELPSEEPEEYQKHFDSPTLPSLRYEKFQITQVIPICKYLCRKANREDLLGKTIQDQVRIEALIFKLLKARKQGVEIGRTCISGKTDQFLRTISNHKQSSKVVSPEYLTFLYNTEWFVGYLSLADFVLYQSLFFMQGFIPEMCNSFYELYMCKFQGLQQIERYLKSGKCCHEISILPSIRKKWRGPRKYK